MKKIYIAVALFLLYIASPYYAVYSFINYLNEGDTIGLKKVVDFPALRESLKDEMKSKLVQQTKRSISSKEEELADKLVSGMGAMFGPAIIDGLVDTFVTPSGLAGLISNPSSALDGKKSKNDNKIPNISWAFFSGLTEFQAKFTEKQEVLTLHFRLTNFRWMLYAITWKDYESNSHPKADLMENTSKGDRSAKKADNLAEMIQTPASDRLGRSAAFPPDVLEIAESILNADNSAFQEVAVPSEELEDWFVLKGFDGFKTPSILLGGKIDSAAILEFEKQPLAVVGLPSLKGQLAVFNATPWNILIPDGEWRTAQVKPDYAVALSREKGMCFLILFEGNEAGIRAVLKGGPR